MPDVGDDKRDEPALDQRRHREATCPCGRSGTSKVVAGAVSRTGLMRAWEGRSIRWWMKRPKCRSRAGTSPGWTVAPRRSAHRGGISVCCSERLATATAALDIQTGGGEVLAGAGAENFPPTLVATEGWPPNVAKATALLHPLGAVVVADPEEPPLPFADDAFDLVTSRHPATVHWSEIARVLAPGGTYFAQHVGSGTNVEISEHFLGPLESGLGRHHEIEADQARAGGLGDRSVPQRAPSPGVLRRGSDGVLPSQGGLDRPGLHRRPLPRPPERPARPDRTRWRLPFDHVSNALRCP